MSYFTLTGVITSFDYTFKNMRTTIELGDSCVSQGKLIRRSFARCGA